jgi:hypothetical protein
MRVRNVVVGSVTPTEAQFVEDLSSSITAPAGDDVTITPPSGKKVIIAGDLDVTGTQTITHTDTNTTEQLLVTNDGTGPAIVINQTGAQPVADFQDDGTSVLYIANGGNLGLGTTSPSKTLEVKAGGSGNGINLISHDNATAVVQLESGSAGGYMQLHDSSNDQKVRIDSTSSSWFTGGNVGIGDTTPGTLLQLKGTAPYVTLKNSTAENTAGGCESKLIFEDHGDNALGQIAVSHSGTADDEKGQLVLSTNNDSGLQAAITIDDEQAVTFAGEIQVASIGYTDGDNAFTIANGGSVTAAAAFTLAAGLTSTAATNTLGATSFNDANVADVNDLTCEKLEFGSSDDYMRLDQGNLTVVTNGNLIFQPSGTISFDDNNIINVGDLNCDSISVDAAAAGLNIDFSGANTGTGVITLANNLAAALTIKEGSNEFLKFATNEEEGITIGTTLNMGSGTNIMFNGEETLTETALVINPDVGNTDTDNVSIEMRAGKGAGSSGYTAWHLTVDSDGGVSTAGDARESAFQIDYNDGSATHNFVRVIGEDSGGSRLWQFQQECNMSGDNAISLGDSANFMMSYASNATTMQVTTAGEQLKIMGTGETLATFVDDGAVTLYHNDTARVATSATGATVTGGLLINSATAVARGAGVTDATSQAMTVANINGEIVTTIKIDIQGLQNNGAIKNIIGNDISGGSTSGGAYLTQLTTAINGNVYKVEMCCIEGPQPSAKLSLAANSDGTLDESELYDVRGTDILIIDGTENDWGGNMCAEIEEADISDIADDYIYLAAGEDDSNAEYTHGKFVIKFYGTPDF